MADKCCCGFTRLLTIVSWLQVFRTEHHSRQLPQKSSLQLMSVLLLTIAAISVGAAGLKHPSEVAAFVGDPGQFLSHVHPASLPWKQVLYTGLLSTDVALWLEVSICFFPSSSMLLNPKLRTALGYVGPKDHHALARQPLLLWDVIILMLLGFDLCNSQLRFTQSQAANPQKSQAQMHLLLEVPATRLRSSLHASSMQDLACDFRFRFTFCRSMYQCIAVL